ncbi:unnamed protein product [Arctia plantaginis]|uniref:C2H2-type domain-containing protein n=1 Tax=Arctia plantaginis TaxID=874455 RepID=A0A8S1BG32_ARCPL|nr:unnamed protein product [Arctia plantaginis]
MEEILSYVTKLSVYYKLDTYTIIFVAEPCFGRNGIKTEATGDDTAPSKKCNNTWLVPINETTTTLSSCCIDVEIKVEPEEYFDTYDENGLMTALPTTSHELKGSHNTRETGFSCRICLKNFANPGNVQRHMLLHTERKHHCTECPKQFQSKEQLDKHMLRHTYVPPERPFVCEHCNKQFKTSSNLMQHKRIHMEVKPYFCSQCHRSFAFKANLTKHQGKSRCKRPIDEPIQCHVCNKVFEKEFLLKSHLRRHDTDRPFSCDQCTMKFKYKSTLIRHIQLHDGIRPYACPVCDKTFTHSGLLKPHMRVHTGEKPYQCPICTKSFAHKHNMQRHAIRHNKIKHLVCDICHKKFPKESRLKYHMKTHVNEKHFSCHICPKKFSHKQNVLRHYTRKHPNAKYECKETDASVALKVWDTIKSKYSDDPGEILG